MSRESENIRKLKEDINMLCEIIVRQSRVLENLQKRVIRCERNYMLLENAKVEELLSKYSKPSNKDVF